MQPLQGFTTWNGAAITKLAGNGSLYVLPLHLLTSAVSPATTKSFLPNYPSTPSFVLVTTSQQSPVTITFYESSVWCILNSALNICFYSYMYFN